jgi:hypothetical protein
MEQIMSRKKFWIIRFRDKTGGYDTYAINTNFGEGRRDWWFSKEPGEAYHFKTRAQAKQALRSPVWKKNSFDRKSECVIEICEICETYTKTWDELQVISNENALIQLARLAESNEHDDESED